MSKRRRAPPRRRFGTSGRRKRAKPIVPAALYVMLSALLIGLFYIFCYYAATVYFGPDRMQAEFLGFAEGNPWGGMAEEILPGIGSLLVTFAIVNSSLANANAGAIASTRSIFSLGRARLLPGRFAAVHPEHRNWLRSRSPEAIQRIGDVMGEG